MNQTQIEHVKYEWPLQVSVIPEFIEPNTAATVARELRDVTSSLGQFVKYDNDWERQKYTLHSLDLMPTSVRDQIELYRSPGFISKLELATGLCNLIPDQANHGSGIHCTLPGGYLNVHQDFTVLPSSYGRPKELKRVLNLLVFLNPYVNPITAQTSGGEFEIWNDTMTQCVRSVRPIFNTAVLFWTPGVNHGQPNPWCAPKGQNRISLSAYYYQECDPSSIEHWSTLYRLRPGECETTDQFKARIKRASPQRYATITTTPSDMAKGNSSDQSSLSGRKSSRRNECTPVRTAH